MQNKKSAFEKSDVRISEIAKVLSHPARLEILRILAKRNVCICGEIVEVLPLSQSTVSQHLKELKAIGIVDGEVEGVKSCYCINWEVFEEASQRLKAYFEELTRLKNGSSCC